MDMTNLIEMFLLNISSNAGQDCTNPDIENNVYLKIGDYLTQHNLASTWQIAWGPVVLTTPISTTPDAVMYLALDEANKRYFLSVAGTNYESLLGFFEDLDVGTTQPWAYGSAPLDVQIATGTLLALELFTPATAPARIPADATPVTLQAYLTTALAGAAAGSYSLITGGHSLGGAVSPLLALWLADTQAQWDSAGVIGSFSAYPSAGPTIGTAAFKAYYNARIPDTTRIHNTKDVVTKGWNMADLQSIPTLYAPQIGKSDCIDWLVGRAETKVAKLDYEQAGTKECLLTGQVNESLIKPSYPSGINFGVQLGYQHIDAYFHLLGIPDHLTADIAVDPVKSAAYWKGVAASLRMAAPAAPPVRLAATGGEGYSDHIKEMFLLNISSNLGEDCTNPGIEAKVLTKVEAYLQQHQLDATWKVAWGPAVFLEPTSHNPDSVVYLALDATSKRYFLSVAGTNSNSLLDMLEDVNVGTTQPWPYGPVQPDVQIAAGTLYALQTLTAITAPAQIAVNGDAAPVTLQAYLTAALAGATAGSYSLITGGHSLGGAVSPLLALWLADTHSQWDSNGAIGSFSAYPSAGPTIGTAGFKAYYNARIPDTTRIHNTIDVVTKGWNRADLATIPTLYTPQIAKSDCVDLLVSRAETKVGQLDYEQVGTQECLLPGQVNASLITSPFPGVNFGIQADYQHVQAYYDMFGIPRDASVDAVFDPAKSAAYWTGVAASLRMAAPQGSSVRLAGTPETA